MRLPRQPPRPGIRVRLPKTHRMRGTDRRTANSLPHAALVDVAAIAGSNGGYVAVNGRIVFREEKHEMDRHWRT